MKTAITLSVLFLTLIAAAPSRAELMDRGHGLIYDDELDITWMQNANYSEGTLTWEDALSWAGGMEFQGYSDWRLPETGNPCSGKGCTGSEMGHLFSSYNITSESPGMFTDVRPYMYWSSSEYAHDRSKAWRFHFKTGYQGNSSKKYTRYAWAVRDGDSMHTVAPEPVSFVLFLSGGIIMTLRRKIK